MKCFKAKGVEDSSSLPQLFLSSLLWQGSIKARGKHTGLHISGSCPRASGQTVSSGSLHPHLPPSTAWLSLTFWDWIPAAFPASACSRPAVTPPRGKDNQQQLQLLLNISGADGQQSYNPTQLKSPALGDLKCKGLVGMPAGRHPGLVLGHGAAGHSVLAIPR